MLFLVNNHAIVFIPLICDINFLTNALFLCQYSLCCCIVWPSFFRLFCKNLGNLQELFGQMVYRPTPTPPAKNCPTAYAYVSNQLHFRKNPKGRELFQRPWGQITKDLSWGNHFNLIAHKSNKVLGVIKRSVGTSNVNIFSMLYKSLVRPIWEYAAPVWSRYLVRNIHLLECMCTEKSVGMPGKGEMSYDERCPAA